MARLDDIRAVLLVADELLQKIESEYDQSLRDKAISQKLSVYIKNYLENLRSPLDYLASEICERILAANSDHKTYFPVSCQNRKAFVDYVDRNFPGLAGLNPSLYAVLEGLQSYNPSGCKALPKLSKLVNENKHSQLSPQTRTESRALQMNFPGGASISMGPGASISGGGVISSGNGWISPAGGTISGASPARVGGGGVQQMVTIWISFTFDSTGDDVIGLLRACRNDVRDILERVRPFLGS